MGPVKRLIALAIALGTLILLAGCGAGPGSPERAAPVAAAAIVPGVNVVAVGDIACPPGGAVTATTCQHAAVAARSRALAPQVLLALGDEQYQNGTYYDFTHAYAPTFGQQRSITRAVVGNHEYQTAGAAGYFQYFAGRVGGGAGYYRVQAGEWQLFLLNSNCDKVNCATEAKWLDQQMTAYPSRCSLVAMHHPRYSSGGEHGSSTSMKPFWDVLYTHRADIVLAGHDHDYERFVPMNGSGSARSNGPTSFVSGTGGKSLYKKGAVVPGSAYFQNTAPGVLQLSLGAGQFSWRFATAGGSFPDSGQRSCVTS